MPFPLDTFRRFLPMGDDLYRTPDFNPQQSGQPRLIRRPQLPTAGGELPAGISEQPQIAMPTPRPLPESRQLPAALSPQPRLESVEYPNYRPMTMAQRPSNAPVPTSDQRPSYGLTRPKPQPMPDIPLVGSPGVTVPYNEIDVAKRDYVMQGAKRNPDGSLAGDNLEFKRSLKDTLLSAAGGFLRGGLPGAAVGATTALASPRMGREQNFKMFYQPGIQESLNRQKEQEAQQAQRAVQSLQQQRLMSDIDENQARQLLIEAQRQKILNPEIKPKKPRENFIELGRGLYDIESGQIIPGTEPLLKPQAEIQAPFSSSPLGIYDRRTGEVTQRAPEKPERPSRIPREARQAAEDVSSLKRGAEKAWNNAKNLPQGSEERKTAEEAARSAQAEYNSAVQGLSDSYGDIYETGAGSDGWAYFKPRGSSGGGRTAQPSGQGGRKGTVGPNILKGVAAKLSKQEGRQVSEDEAARMLEEDGYTVRRQ